MHVAKAFEAGLARSTAHASSFTNSDEAGASRAVDRGAPPTAKIAHANASCKKPSGLGFTPLRGNGQKEERYCEDMLRAVRSFTEISSPLQRQTDVSSTLAETRD